MLLGRGCGGSNATEQAQSRAGGAKGAWCVPKIPPIPDQRTLLTPPSLPCGCFGIVGFGFFCGDWVFGEIFVGGGVDGAGTPLHGQEFKSYRIPSQARAAGEILAPKAPAILSSFFGQFKSRSSEAFPTLPHLRTPPSGEGSFRSPSPIFCILYCILYSLYCTLFLTCATAVQPSSAIQTPDTSLPWGGLF